MTTSASIQTDDLASKRALVSGGTRGNRRHRVRALENAGAQITTTGRHAVEHLHADEFLVPGRRRSLA